MLDIYIAYNRTGTHILVGPIKRRGMEYVFKLLNSLVDFQGFRTLKWTVFVSEGQMLTYA